MKAFLFCLLFIGASSFTMPVKEFTLEYTFKTGDRYTWLQTTKQTVKQTIPSMGDMTIEMKVDGAFNLKVLELTRDGARLEVQYSSLKVDSKSPMGNVNVDSNGKSENMENKVVRSMIGKPFYVYMTRHGVIEKVEGSENLLSGINSLGLNDATMQNARQLLQQTVGESSLKTSLETGLLNYPDKKVAMGDTWRNKTELTFNFPILLDNEWSLKTMEGSVATIEANGELTTTDKEKITTLPNGIKSKVDLAGKQSAAGKLNVKTGWPTELTVTSRMSGKLVLLAGGMIPSDMDVPMDISTESVYTIVKK
jgi:hypothetical protein